MEIPLIRGASHFGKCDAPGSRWLNLYSVSTDAAQVQRLPGRIRNPTGLLPPKIQLSHKGRFFIPSNSSDAVIRGVFVLLRKSRNPARFALPHSAAHDNLILMNTKRHLPIDILLAAYRPLALFVGEALLAAAPFLPGAVQNWAQHLIQSENAKDSTI